MLIYLVRLDYVWAKCACMIWCEELLVFSYRSPCLVPVPVELISVYRLGRGTVLVALSVWLDYVLTNCACMIRCEELLVFSYIRDSMPPVPVELELCLRLDRGTVRV